MTQATPQSTGEKETALGPPCAGRARLLPAVLLLCLCGCIGNPMTLLKSSKTAEPEPPGEALILRGDTLESDAKPAAGTSAAELEHAKDLYRKKDYAKAQKLFNKIASSEKNTPHIAEEARFYEGECLRLQALYPKAASTFNKQLKDFPSGTFHQQACQKIFEIANYWLDETRDQMEAKAKTGKTKSSWTGNFVHFEKTKPLLDMQGHALEALEQVYLNDPTGPLGEKALFFIGSVRFYLEQYREADHYFNQLFTNFPNGPNASKALELTIICKQLSTGGPEYDGRRLANARRLVHTALNAYPELKDKRGDFLERQLATINLQQAAKDFSIAEFYQRVGRGGSAYFYYEVVRRRYPGTKYAEEATRRMTALQARAEKKQAQAEKQAAWKWLSVPAWPFTAKPAPAAAQAQVAPGQPIPTGPMPPRPGTPLQPEAEALPQPRTLPPPGALPNLPGANSIGNPPQ